MTAGVARVSALDPRFSVRTKLLNFGKLKIAELLSGLSDLGSGQGWGCRRVLWRLRSREERYGRGAGDCCPRLRARGGHSRGTVTLNNPLGSLRVTSAQCESQDSFDSS